jgi:hypothetical protein
MYRISSLMVVAPVRSMSWRVITSTGAGPSASIRLMFDPVMIVFSVVAVCACAIDTALSAAMTATVNFFGLKDIE